MNMKICRASTRHAVAGDLESTIVSLEANRGGCRGRVTRQFLAWVLHMFVPTTQSLRPTTPVLHMWSARSSFAPKALGPEEGMSVWPLGPPLYLCLNGTTSLAVKVELLWLNPSAMIIKSLKVLCTSDKQYLGYERLAPGLPCSCNATAIRLL